MSPYWVREALQTYQENPTQDALEKLLERLVEAVEELESAKADLPADERGV